MSPPLYRYQLSIVRSIGTLCLDELAVEAGDVAERDVLGTLSRTSSGVGTVAEAKLVHLADHGAGTAGTLNLTLGKKGKLAYLGTDEEHCRTILASCNTCTATDTCSRVHCYIGNLLGYGEIVGIGSSATIERHVTSCLLYLVKGITVDHKVAYHRECGRTPRFDGDGVLVVELTHVELTGGYALYRTMGMSVDIKRAHPADTLAAIAVKYHRLLTLLYELLVEHIEHFEEAASGGDVLHTVVLERPRFFRATLAPNLEVYIYIMFHFASDKKSGD